MPELITAIATLLWPLITLMALFVFRRAIGRVLRTAERRELEFEVGGQKLTMRELNDQQNELIQDLQRQLSIMTERLEEREHKVIGTDGSRGPTAPARDGLPASPDFPGGPALPGTAEGNAPPVPAQPGLAEGNGDGDGEPTRVQAPTGPEPFAVLWVAERPENHALLMQQLRENGVRVMVVTTTAEALSEASGRPYRLIVSDMSRPEDDRRRHDAGLNLLRELRDLGVDVPVIVFTAPRAQQQYGADARKLGAVATTSSGYEMFRHFRNFGLL